MDFRILYARPALTDLHQILAWSRENHPTKTEQFVSTLLNHVDLLRSFPRLGEPVKGFPGVRRILHTPLHVYYRILPEQKTVEILRFWHVARELPTLL